MNKNLSHALAAVLAAGATSASADILHLDDVIIDGSLCVGFDCVNGESFGFDTIRLKENNLRIKAQDTSSTASFPSNDWQITFNDSTNGGQNKFSIDDIDGGRTPFTIEASAPSHSLYVDDGGRVGFGTSTPVADLHVKTGNTPTLRLEQDGSSGFSAQTWDMAGNEANFFIRDATSGSTLPFRIFPGAPTNSLTIEGSTGDVGLGTTSPSDKLHVYEASSAARIKLTRDDKPSQDGSAEDQDWILNSNGTFRISAGTDAAELTLDALGNLTVTGGYFVNAMQLNVPDYVFESGYELKSIEEQASYMAQNKHLPSVGAAPGKGAGANLNLVDQQLGMLEELEKAHLYIVHLNQELQQLEQRLAQLEQTAN